MIDMTHIFDKQNKESNLNLLVAQRALYSKAKNIRLIELIVLLILAAISAFPIMPIELFNNLPNYFNIFITILVVISCKIGNYSINNQEKAANIQEQFDCKLFQLEYELIVNDEEVVQLSNDAIAKDSGIKEQVRNWYIDKIKEFEFPYSALACQQQNIGWDLGLSKKYLGFLIKINILLTTLIVIVGFLWHREKSLFKFNYDLNYLSINIENLYNYLVFSFSIIKIPFSICLNIHRSIKEKEDFLQRYSNIFQKITDNNANDLKNSILRSIQDKIYEFRKKHRPVPDWFYRFYKYKEEAKSRKRLENQD